MCLKLGGFFFRVWFVGFWLVVVVGFVCVGSSLLVGETGICSGGSGILTGGERLLVGGRRLCTGEIRLLVGGTRLCTGGIRILAIFSQKMLNLLNMLGF